MSWATFASHLGIPADQVEARAGLAFAGFVGGVISLGFVKELRLAPALVAVLCGLAAGLYLTPLAVDLMGKYLGVTAGGTAVALVLGLVAMPLFERVHRFAHKGNPWEILERLRK